MNNPTNAPKPEWADDPTADEVRYYALQLAAELPEQPDGDDKAAVRHQLEALEGLLKLTAREGNNHATYAAATAAAAAMDLLRRIDYHQAVGDAANDLLPLAMRMARTARQAERRGCRLGGDGPCDDTGLRARVRLYDAFGMDERDPGCPLHVAEDARCWDHGGEVEVVLVGPRDARRATLSHLHGQWQFMPRWVEVPPQKG
ncbi:hypothetical protein ACFQ6V_30850 [Streptomyces roseifaciens]